MNDCEENDDILKKREKLDFYMNLVRKYWHKRPEFDLADSAELVSDVPRKTGDEYRAAYELGMKTAFDKALFESDCTFGFVDGLLDGLYLLSVRLEEEVIRRNEEIEAEELAREEKAAEIIEKLEERLHESGGNSEIEDMLQDAYDGYFGNNRPFKETDQSIYFSMDWKRITPSEEISEAIDCVGKEKKLSKAERVPEFEPVPDDLGSVPGERFEDGAPVPKENGEGSGNAETNEGSGRNAASPLSEETKNPPRREGGENGVPEKGGRTGTPHAEADTGDSSQTGGGVKPVEGNKEKQGGTRNTAVPIEKRRGAAKEFSEKIGVLVKSLEEMAKGAGLKIEDASDFVNSVKQVASEVLGKHGLDGRGAKEVSRLVRLAEKAVEGYSKSNNAAEFGKVIDEAKKLLEWSNKPSRKRKVPTSNINARALYSEFENVAEAKLEEEKPKVPSPKNEAPRPTFRSIRIMGFRQRGFAGSRF